MTCTLPTPTTNPCRLIRIVIRKINRTRETTLKIHHILDDGG